MDFLTTSLPNLMFLAAGAAGMWAYFTYRPDRKVAAAKDAKQALQALAKEMGADNSDAAKAARDELRRHLEAMRETFESIPRQD